MKTIIKKKTIVPEPVEITTTLFGCDECDFTAASPSEVEAHVAHEHALKDRDNVFCGRDVYCFDSKEAATCWLKHMYASCDVRWDGPGWYVLEENGDDDWEGNDTAYAELVSLSEMANRYDVLSKSNASLARHLREFADEKAKVGGAQR